jgi:hypothetical protein
MIFADLVQLNQRLSAENLRHQRSIYNFFFYLMIFIDLNFLHFLPVFFQVNILPVKLSVGKIYKPVSEVYNF